MHLSKYTYPACQCFSLCHTREKEIAKYSELEGTHEDQQAQLLNEWSIEGTESTTLAFFFLAPSSIQLS